MRKKYFPMFYLVAFFNSLVFFAPGAILVRTRCGITLSQFFILQAILSLGIFLFEVPCGWITDRIGYKKSILFSQFLMLLTRIMFFIGGKFWLFALEALTEAFAACFVSGTNESYLYEFCEKSSTEFVKKQSVISNFASAAFILCTLLYAPLNKCFSLNVLIGLSLISSFDSFLISFFLPDVEIKRNKTLDKYNHSYLIKKMIKNKNVQVLFILSCLTGFSEIAVNFLYILKIHEVGLDSWWITGVIMVYTLFSFLIPVLVHTILKFRPAYFMCFALIFSSILSLCISIYQNYYVLIPMILLPFSISLSGIFYGGLINRLIDLMGFEAHRAEFFSLLNQGGNFLQIIILFSSGFFSRICTNTVFACVSVLLLIASFVPIIFRANLFFVRLEEEGGC